MSRYQAASKLQVAASRWSARLGTAADVVTAACDALVAGLDTPGLCILAGVSLRDPDYDVYEYLPTAMRELHLTFCPRDSEESRNAVTRAISVQVITGDLAPDAAASMIHSAFGHELPLAERLAELDDEYDILEYSDRTEAEVDADVLAECRNVVERTPDPLAALRPYLVLWDQVGDLFAVNDGSLPEVEFTQVSDHGCTAIWQYLLKHAAPLEGRRTLWSTELDRELQLNQQSDPIRHVLDGKAEAFHVLLTGVTYDDVAIPDLGVFIYPAGVNLDYRRGDEWSPITLGAFAKLLGSLRSLDPECRLTYWHITLPQVQVRFSEALDRFLHATTSGAR